MFVQSLATACARARAVLPGPQSPHNGVLTLAQFVCVCVVCVFVCVCARARVHARACVVWVLVWVCIWVCIEEE